MNSTDSSILEKEMETRREIIAALESNKLYNYFLDNAQKITASIAYDLLHELILACECTSENINDENGYKITDPSAAACLSLRQKWRTDADIMEG